MVVVNDRMVVFSKLSLETETLLTTIILICMPRSRIERDKMHRNG